jgi:S1-C subfamily serine protease
MRRMLLVFCLLQAAVVSIAQAAGPFGTIAVGTWKGGAYSDDNTGNFSHCAASSAYGSGVILIVGQNASNGWLLGFASPNFHLNKGATVPIDVTFDGQEQARLFATATTDNLATAILPPNVARTFQKSSLMVAVSGRTTLQFNLGATGPLIAMLANCVSKVKEKGLDAAAATDFSVPKPVAAKDTPGGASKSGRTGSYSGTGFVIDANGHIITNHHVIDGCVGDIKGNLTGAAPTVLRVVSKDPANDMALLQGAADTFKSFAKIRDRSIRSGDPVTAIGFPFHGLLTSDFTVTTGIVSSLSGIKNDSRYLQISAAVQPGNSGGPLIDGSGRIVGIVSEKLNAIGVLRATGAIPENINFAIKPGAIRDFLDNSAVAYETAAPGAELKTSDIADAARAWTLLITCTATEPVASTKR